MKKGVLKNFTNSQQVTCARVSFLIKLQAQAKTLTFFIEHLWVTAFDQNYAFIIFPSHIFFSKKYLVIEFS